MRIAIIADPIDNQRGGVHVYTRELVAHLLATPSDVEWILVRERYDPLLTGAKQIVIPNIRIGMGLAALRLFFIVPLVLWWYKVDVVFEPAHFGPFNLPRRIRRVTMIHDLTPLLYPGYHRFHSQLLQRMFLKGILRRADLILANSRHTAEDIRRFFPFTRDKVLPVLLGCEPVMRPQVSLPQTWKDRVGEAYWLAVGTIEPRKNLIRLLDAYATFRLHHPEVVRLVLVGQRGWKAKPFYDALDAHPYREDIVLTGYVTDEELAALYGQAIALVYPSEYEGFGLPVLEAMACGCPVICSDVSSLPEVGGIVAQYVHPMDVAGWTAAMTMVYSWSPVHRATMQQQCLAHAAGFDWSRHARSWLEAMRAFGAIALAEEDDASADPVHAGHRSLTFSKFTPPH